MIIKYFATFATFVFVLAELKFNQTLICSQAPGHSVGDCPYTLPGYAYINRTNKCDSFVENGCEIEGDNWFWVKEDCEKTCVVEIDICTQAPGHSVGDCPLKLNGYAYIGEMNKCEPFHETGCEIEGFNWFWVKAACERACVHRPAICMEDPGKGVGDCPTVLSGYVYNRFDNVCVARNRGGCYIEGGNWFWKEKDCKETCIDLKIARNKNP